MGSEVAEGQLFLYILFQLIKAQENQTATIPCPVMDPGSDTLGAHRQTARHYTAEFGLP